MTLLSADVSLKQIFPESVQVPSAEKGEGLMRLVIFVVAILVALSSTSAFTQVKQRVDEKGVQVQFPITRGDMWCGEFAPAARR